uniref:Metalloendopeptidase n=1 Tax=Nippostrongylus brasiliensis TaxID=27835 RepID=A0A0N4XLK8_NIPBR
LIISAAKTKSIVKQSLAYLQARSCLTFTEDATAPNRVEVFIGAGCFSKLGMEGGVQQLSLGKGCEVIGLATHEFIHALGSRHMHGRFDRDDYITVDTTNVLPDKVGQFGKSGDLVTINLTPYEYGSVMHYGANTFTTKGYSLKPKIGRYLQTEGSRYVTFYDVKMLNIYYKCPCR